MHREGRCKLKGQNSLHREQRWHLQLLYIYILPCTCTEEGNNRVKKGQEQSLSYSLFGYRSGPESRSSALLGASVMRSKCIFAVKAGYSLARRARIDRGRGAEIDRKALDAILEFTTRQMITSK
jgi:hypothetical protein